MKSLTIKKRRMNAWGVRLGLATLAVLLSSIQSTMASDLVSVPFLAKGSPVSIAIRPDGTVQITAKGHATHLGQYTAFVEITNIPQGPGELPRFEGDITMTASNGDELHLHHSGVTVQIVPIREGEGSYVITGGTGRFEGASGEGSFSSYDNDTTFDGNIILAHGK